MRGSPASRGMRRRPARGALLGLVCVLAFAVAPSSCWFRDLDAYRGWTGMQLAASGRFRVEQVQGVWWLVTPTGRPFFSAGITSVRSFGDYAPDLDAYPYLDAILARWGSTAAWAENALDQIRGAGFTTIGAFSEVAWFRGRFPYTEILTFSATAPIVPGTTNAFNSLRDFYDPAFLDGVAQTAELARPCAEDPFCIGVFTDNELPWSPMLTQSLSHLDGYLRLPAGAPGKLALQAFLAQRWSGDVAAFNAAWKASLASFDALQDVSALSSNTPAARADRFAFRAHVAAHYFRTVHDALRAVDPGVLILGARFLAFSAAPDVVAAAAPWVDVLSINAYEWNDTWTAIARNAAAVSGQYPFDAVLDDVDAMYATAGKPILISEFGYRAADSGLPNSTPPQYPVLEDQAERADVYEQYMERVLQRPFVVGAHWFKHADQPFTGRNDGEDNNWGFVDIADRVYPEMYLRMWSVHHSMMQRRLALASP